MATADLTNLQLDAAATAVKTIAQPAKPAAVWDGARAHVYKADASAGALVGKLVVEIDLGDDGPTVLIDPSDATIVVPAEFAGFVRTIKRCVVEARARKGAA